MIFAFIAMSFLIFQRGIWAFADSGFYYDSVLQAKRLALSKLGQFVRTDGFYFGFDNSAMSFAHLIISFYQLLLTSIFGSDLGQIIYYFLYYFLGFYFGQKLLKKLMPDASDLSIGLGALFLAFNPFSLLVATLFTISYVYVSFIIFCYFFLNYLEKGKVHNLAVSVFFGVYLFSYLRLIPIIIFSLLAIIWVFYDKKYFNLSRWLFFSLVFGLCASPILTTSFPSLASSDSIVSNYQDAFSKFEQANYNFKQSFTNSFSHPGGFTPSALSFFYNHLGIPGFADNFAASGRFEFFKTVQIAFNIGLLLAALIWLKNKSGLRIIILICLIFLLNTLAFFTSFNIFSHLNKTIFVFLYNDYGFLQFSQSLFYSFLVVILVGSLSKLERPGKKVKIFSFLIVIYLAVNLLPFLSGHYGFKKVSNIPAGYQSDLISKNSYTFSEATIFAPYHWLKFNWAPYYLDLNSFFYTKYESLIVPNLRLVDNDFVRFYNEIYDNLGQININNLAIFNLKNIFIFHDVVNADKNIDTYQVLNLENNSLKIKNQLSRQANFYIAEQNNNFTHYRFNGADNYDFFIYCPKNILGLDVNNFYNDKLNIEQKPVLLSKSELNSVNSIKDINFSLNSPYVSYKAAADNANKYYLKLNVNKAYPFLLQFNQTFSDNWRVYFIDKKDWDNVECQTAWENFETTENRRCHFSSTSFDYADFGLIAKKYLKPENHFKGNIIGNLFLIAPGDIPRDYQAGDELYLMIYFEKQMPYSLTLTVSGLTFLLLILLSILEIIKTRRHES